MEVILRFRETPLRQKLTISRLAQRAEKDLQTYLTSKDSTFLDIAHFLAQYLFHTPQVSSVALLTLEDTARHVRTSFCKTLNLRWGRKPRTGCGMLMEKSIVDFERN